MMGERQVDQGSLFYEFSLERHVPANHLLRAIDRFVDLGDLRARLAPFYSSMGRPSIDPDRLCEEVHLNLAYRWFCRLGLDGEVPDHSTFSKNRHGRFRDSDLMRHLFETVVGRCIAEGLVGGEGFAVDASLIKAEASRQNGVEGSKGLPREMTSRAIAEYLAVLDDAAFGAATEVTPKFLAGRPGGTLDRRAWRTSLLRLLQQLSDRSRPCDHRRRRGVDRGAPGRGDGRQNNDRPGRRTARSLP
jgi:transposase